MRRCAAKRAQSFYRLSRLRDFWASRRGRFYFGAKKDLVRHFRGYRGTLFATLRSNCESGWGG